jgi:hypothetical protein
VDEEVYLYRDKSTYTRSRRDSAWACCPREWQIDAIEYLPELISAMTDRVHDVINHSARAQEALNAITTTA